MPDGAVADVVDAAALAAAPTTLRLEHVELSVRRGGTWRETGRFALGG